MGNLTVGTYLDEVPVITITGYDGSPELMLVDIDRIEVLRGPQGTSVRRQFRGRYDLLHHWASLDSHAFKASFRQELGGTRHGGFNYDSSGALNLPVVEDKFAVRLSAKFGRDSGYIDRHELVGSLAAGTAEAGPRIDDNVNSAQKLALNAKALWTISDGFTVTPAVLFQRYDLDDTNAFLTSLGHYNEFNQIRSTGSDKLLIPSLDVQKSLGFADLHQRRSIL